VVIQIAVIDMPAVLGVAAPSSPCATMAASVISEALIAGPIYAAPGAAGGPALRRRQFSFTN
jgi:hypothetical protein